MNYCIRVITDPFLYKPLPSRGDSLLWTSCAPVPAQPFILQHRYLLAETDQNNQQTKRSSSTHMFHYRWISIWQCTSQPTFVSSNHPSSGTSAMINLCPSSMQRRAPRNKSQDASIAHTQPIAHPSNHPPKPSRPRPKSVCTIQRREEDRRQYTLSPATL